MVLEYTIKGKVKIDIHEYIDKMFLDMHDGYEGTETTPATSYLFEVNKQRKIEQEEKERFHHIVVQILFCCKQARPNLQTVVAFLNTCVNTPAKDDEKNETC